MIIHPAISFKRLAWLVGGAATLLSSACLSSTSPEPSVIQLAGNWSYSGVQTQPVRQTLAGTLTVSRESGSSFEGRLDLVETDEQSGQSTVLGGLVSGSESATSVIDFDANLETVRRHVGQIVADTITGTWIGSATDGSMSSGTFRAERATK
ncbi:MAG: hypothetical protein ACREMS_03220 [Gemmatimonadaceae bacterium]